MKYKQLQKKLIKAGLICGAVICVCIAIFMFATKLSEDKQAEIEAVEKKAIEADARYNMFETEYKEAIAAIKFYEENDIKDNEDSKFFRRDWARNYLARVKDEMKLPDLKFSMDQFKKVPSKPERSVALYSSLVKVEFTANSDVDAYNLIKNIITTFPGQVMIRNYNIARTNEITPTIMEQALNGNVAGVVKGNLEFNWNSIRNNDVSATATPPAGGQPPQMGDIQPQLPQPPNRMGGAQ